MNVFLSYSSSERELAERLAYSLRDEGYSVFFDRTSLPPGEGYHSRIRSAIDSCDLFIFLISLESVSRGSYALTELGIAQHKWDSPSRRILPVMVSEVDLDTIPPYLNAVTVLRPQGEIVAEVLEAVSRLRLRDVEPVKVTSSLTNAGWVLYFDILGYEPIKEIFYRFADEETFKSTGFTQVRDPRTGLVQPRSHLEIPLFKGTHTLLVKYTDSAGREHGPYTVILDAVKEIVAQTKDALEIT
jgi:TIR domain